jgi:hypothetical protein
MAVLRSARGEVKVPSRCLIGRSALADVRLESRRSSNEHASLGCHGGRWILRDLGSSNGTSVDGKLLSPRERVVLSVGQTLRFGDDSESWTLVSAAPADPCAVLLGPQEYRWGDATLLVLPSADAPEASVFPAGDEWRVDDGSELKTTTCGDVIRLPSGYFRLILPETQDPALGTAQSELSVQQMELKFRVSVERVTVEVSQAGVHVQLPARACVYTLLALARLRRGDSSDPDDGWVSCAELAELRACIIEKVNVDVHRLRKLFQEAKVQEAARIVERDDAKRLRIGVSRVKIFQE